MYMARHNPIENFEQRPEWESKKVEGRVLVALKESQKNSLGAFGKMLDGFIFSAKISPDNKKKTETFRQETLAQAEAIMNDSTRNEAWKSSDLQKLFGTFKENKEFFPTPAESVAQTNQDLKTEQQKRIDFHTEFLQALDTQHAEQVAKSKQAVVEAAKINPDWPPADWNPEAEKKLAGDLEKVSAFTSFA